MWFLLDVPAQQRASSVLLIPYPGLNSLRLYEAGSGGTPWRVLAAGDDLPVANWAVPHLFQPYRLKRQTEPDARCCCGSRTRTR